MVKMRSFGPNAPQKPSNAFMLFLRHRCNQSSDLSSLPFVEKRRHISTMWASLAQEQKQIYIDQATAERRTYEKKFAEYKKTDEYKQWLAKNANNKSSRGKTGKFVKDMNGDAGYFDDEFAFKFRRIPIFTPEFLEYNRKREMQLRNLRKEVCFLQFSSKFIIFCRSSNRRKRQLHLVPISIIWQVQTRR